MPAGDDRHLTAGMLHFSAFEISKHMNRFKCPEDIILEISLVPFVALGQYLRTLPRIIERKGSSSESSVSGC